MVACDPLKVARALWPQSRERYPAAREADLSESLEDKHNESPKGDQASDCESNLAKAAVATSRSPR
jgi:hypothetical protein